MTRHVAGNLGEPSPFGAPYPQLDPPLEAEEDPDRKQRRRPRRCNLATLQAAAHQLRDPKIAPKALIVIIVTILLLNRGTIRSLLPTRKPPNPYALASTWPIPPTAPAVQRQAQLRHQAFCRALFSYYSQPPSVFRLAWVPGEDPTDLSALLVPPPPAEATDDPNAQKVALLYETAAATTGSYDPGIAVLMKVDGIQPLDAHQDPYSMYVFQPRGAAASDIVSNEIINTRGWEPLSVFTHIGELDRLARELNLPREEIFFLDIGANVGAFTMGVAAAGFSVIAVEAMGVNAAALSASLCVDPDMARSVTLLPTALGREKARCAVWSGRDNALDGNIRCGLNALEEAGMTSKGMIKRQTVDIARLDDLLEDWIPSLKGRVGSLKIDVEGFEPWVYEGAQRILREVRPRFIQMEVSHMSVDGTNVTAVEMLTKLTAVGYELRESAFARPIRPTDLEDKMPEGAGPFNVYLVDANTSGTM